MSADSDANPPADNANSFDDQVEALLFACLEAEQPNEAIEAAATAHPKLAEALRRAYSEMLRFDLVGSTSSSASAQLALPADSVPEQLGEYRLLNRLGAGGMGVVYLARDDVLQRTVALKLIRPEHLYMPGARERFQREVETIARLQHPGIVPIYGVGKSDGMPYFTMQHIRGCSMSTALTELQAANTPPEGRRLLELAADQANASPTSESSSGSGSTHGIDTLNWADTCVSLAAQVAAALHHAHERGVLHRDVKPSNILLTTEGRAMLVDFGLAWADDTDQRLTQSASQLGSLPYLPPEHIGGKATDPSRAADVYSLGVTLYEMLTLRNPFLGKNGEETRRNILGARPLRLRTEQRGVSWELETVCMTALDPDPSKRYRTMLEFQRDLERVRNRESIEARRPGVLRRTRRWAQRHPTIVAAMTVALLSSMAALVVFFIQERTARAQSDSLRNTAEVERYAALVSNADIELRAGSRPERARLKLAQCREEDRGWEWSHLEFVSDQAVTPAAHADGVIQDLTWLPDGENFLIATQDKELICRSRTQRELWRISDLATSSFVFRKTARGHELICGRLTAELWVHDTLTGKPVQAFDNTNSKLVGELTTLVASPDGSRIYSTCSDGNVSVWDAETRSFLQNFGKHQAQAHSLAISPDGSRIATGGFDKTVKVFDTNTLTETNEFQIYHWGLDLSFAADSRHLVLTDGLQMQVVDLDSETPTQRPLDPTHRTVLAVKCSPDGKLVAASVERRVLHIYQVSTKPPFRIRRIARLAGHEGLLQHISFTPDSQSILTGSTDQTVRIWSHAHCAELATRPHQRMVTGVVFGPDDTVISSDSRGNICETESDGSFQSLATTDGQSAHSESVVALLTTGDERSFSSIDKSGRLIDWSNKEDGWQAVQTTETGLEATAATTLPFTPDSGSFLFLGHVPVVATKVGDIHVLGIGPKPRTWHAHDEIITAMVSDGVHIWSACVAGELKCWDGRTGELVRSAPSHPDWISSLVMAPDGSWLASGCADTRIRIIDTKTGEVRHTMEGHGRAPMTMVTDKTGSRLISSGGFDAEIRFWQPDTGRCVLSMGRGDSTLAMAFNQRTGTLALGGRLGHLHMLRTRTGGARAFSMRPAPPDTLTAPPGGRRPR
tara:strand:- start:32320 stop:35718 length:3399 start_codon:yes stop_codon:yes gene_type:complete